MIAPWSVVQQRTRGEAERFANALARPRQSQHEQLGRILELNAESEFGRHHGFRQIHDADAFRARVPIHRYEDLAHDIHACCEDGGANRLGCEPIVHCELTSGTTAHGRLIPYTVSALEAFQRAVHPWLNDVLERWPAIGLGRAYFALSPALRRPRRTRAGIPIGADDDGIYFGSTLSGALAELSAIPPEIAAEQRHERWRYLTLRWLIDADDLSLVSVWSPSFFTSVLDGLSVHAESLARDLADGTVSGPDGAERTQAITPRPERASALERALASEPVDTRALWPRLALLSCWTDGTAARFLPTLERLLPHVAIQGKGLIATEGVVSVPFGAAARPTLAVRSGFFEFIDDGDRSWLAHEVRPGESYRIVITTYGGLYRYDIGDRVRVHASHAAAPTLEFIGRGDSASDLCGEKITETQVQAGLRDVPGFALLAPVPGERPRYRLLLDAAERDDDEAERTAEVLDRRLRSNPHYDHARRLDQLGAIVAERHHDPLAAYLRWQTHRGRRLGDIKPPVLYADHDLDNMLEVD